MTFQSVTLMAHAVTPTIPLVKCEECFALVQLGDQSAHERWHQLLGERPPFRFVADVDRPVLAAAEALATWWTDPATDGDATPYIKHICETVETRRLEDAR